MIKSFLTEDDDKIQNLVKDLVFENNFAFTTRSIFEFEDDLAFLTRSIRDLTRSIREKRLPRRYQNFADITVLLQDDQSIPSFVDFRRKEINDLLKKRVFELITIDKVLENIRIFNSRFVDEVKH